MVGFGTLQPHPLPVVSLCVMCVDERWSSILLLPLHILPVVMPPTALQEPTLWASAEIFPFCVLLYMWIFYHNRKSNYCEMLVHLLIIQHTLIYKYTNQLFVVFTSIFFLVMWHQWWGVINLYYISYGTQMTEHSLGDFATYPKKYNLSPLM